jgi:hypoxanthine phosphoribosyltransferase
MSKKHISWDEYHQAAKKLAENYKSDHYDAIIAISRGGLIAGTIMAHQLGIKKVYSIGVTSYGEDNDQGELEMYQKLSETDALDVKHKSFILVDEVIDSGSTLAQVKAHLQENGISPDNYKTVCLYDKTDDAMSGQLIDAFYVKSSKNDWLVFPYEK